MFPELSLTRSILLIYCCSERKTPKKNRKLLCLMPTSCPTQGNQGILGFWIPLSGLVMPFSLSVKLLDSGFLELYARFHKKKFPDSGIRITLQEAKQVYL